LSSTSPFYALRLARRELRGGVSGLGVFLGCLVLGVTAVAAIGSIAASASPPTPTNRNFWRRAARFPKSQRCGQWRAPRTAPGAV
jgi:hypothetical protein